MSNKSSRTHPLAGVRFPLTAHNVVAYWKGRGIHVVQVQPTTGMVVFKCDGDFAKQDLNEFESDKGLIRQAWFKNRPELISQFDDTNLKRVAKFKGLERKFAMAQANRLRGRILRGGITQFTARGRVIAKIEEHGAAPIFILAAPENSTNAEYPVAMLAGQK